MVSGVSLVPPEHLELMEETVFLVLVEQVKETEETEETEEMMLWAFQVLQQDWTWKGLKTLSNWWLRRNLNIHLPTSSNVSRVVC